jgi:hypothetical protein
MSRGLAAREAALKDQEGKEKDARARIWVEDASACVTVAREPRLTFLCPLPRQAKREETIVKAEQAIDKFYEDYNAGKERSIKENKSVASR